MVNEQLAKESTIRLRVEEARQVVLTGLGIVQNLINIPSGLGVELWFHQVLTILLGGVVQNCGDFVGVEAVDAYLVPPKNLVVDRRICRNLFPNGSEYSEYLLALHYCEI